jgi:hypothetical protein
VSSVGFHLYSPIFLREHITLSYLVTTLSKRKTRKNLMRRKRLAIEKALIKELTEEITGSGLKGSGMIKLFRWVYFMLSRGEGMLSALRKIGFEVDTNEILRTNPNPYTGRRHAWFIEAHKRHLSCG